MENLKALIQFLKSTNVEVSKNRSHSEDFKYEMTWLVIEEGRPFEEVAREFEIPPQKLRKWKRKYLRIMSLPDVYKKGCF